MKKLLKITATIFIQVIMASSAWAGSFNHNCLSPALQVSSWEFQQTARRMIIEHFARESLLSGFDYYRLKLDIFFGSKIRVKDIEREFREQLSEQDIMLYTRSENTADNRQVRLKVQRIFEAIIQEHGAHRMMFEYLDAIMKVLYQELRLNINKQRKSIISNIKNKLRSLEAEDILIFNQASNSLKKHEIRKKVLDIIERMLGQYGVSFNNRLEKKIEGVMLELEQELKQDVSQAIEKDQGELRQMLFKSLSSRQRLIYFSQDTRLNIEQREARDITKTVFLSWLQKKDIYFEGATWDYYYGFKLGKIMKEVFEKTPGVYLRSPNNNTALWQMADQIKQGNYENISNQSMVKKYMQDVISRINKVFVQAKPVHSAAPDCNEHSPVFITDAVVISEKSYCLGFLSHDPLIKSKLKDKLGQAKFNELFPVPTLILSTEMFINVSPAVFEEYIYLVMNNWQGLGNVFAAQDFFPENYNGFIEGKDYEPNIIKDISKPDKPIVRLSNSKFQPGHIGQATKPFFGRTGMKFWEIIKQKTNARSEPALADLSIEEQIKVLSLKVITIFGNSSVYIIEQAI